MLPARERADFLRKGLAALPCAIMDSSLICLLRGVKCSKKSGIRPSDR